MKFRKLLSLLLSVLLIAGIAAGCSGGTNDPADANGSNSGNREEEVNQEGHDGQRDAATDRTMTFGIQNYSAGGLDPAAAVMEGDIVLVGDVIGTVGDTNLAETALEPHLHFEMLRDGEAVDPLETMGLLRVEED